MINIKEVRRRINEAAERAGRDPKGITLIAVTKTAAVDQVKEAIDSGVTDFGENRVQAAKEKISCLSGFPDIKWHMIGHLQTNKVKQAALLFDAVHSVDSLRLAKELSLKAIEVQKTMPVFIEVNVSGEETKYGIKEGEAEGLIEESRRLGGLELKGLMTMAPFSDDPEASRPYFRSLKLKAESLKLKELSMGMSGDFEVAIEEGATIVRIGSAIFNK